MSINLTAVAKLNTAPFVAGLRTLQKGTAGLAATNASAAKQENAANTSRAASRAALGQAAVAARQAEVQSLNQVAKAQASASRATAASVQGLSSQRYLYHDLSRQALGAAVAIGALPVASLAAAVSWERDFANVVRTADPILATSKASVDGLRLSLVDMVQSMPASWGDVTEIATLANQMGIASSQTAAFTRTVAMFAATSGVSVDITATAFGRLNSIVKLSDGGFQGLADSILKVGVNSVATEGEIINIVTQISSIAGAAGFTDKQMIGLAGSMASVRIPPELSRGVITRVFGQISRAASDGGISLEGFSRIAGMSATDFKDSWGKEGVAGNAFVSFMNGLKDLGPQAEAELRSLGITSVRDVPVLLRLASARDSEGNIGGLLQQTFDDANNAAGETQRQYAIMADTVGAKLKMVGNNLMAFFSAIGSSAIGPVGDVLDFIIEKLSNLTNSLGDDFKLFGEFSLGMTVGEVISWTTAITAAGAGLLALGSIAGKMAAGGVAIKQMMGIMAGSGAGAAATGRFAKLGGDIKKQWAGVPMVLGRAADSTKAIANSSTKAMLSSTRAPLQAMGIAATAAATQVNRGFSMMRTGASAAGSFIGKIPAFAFGPWGIAIAAAAVGISYLVEKTRTASTSVEDLSLELAKSAKLAEASFESITIGKLFGQEAKPFANGIRSLEEYQAKLAETSETAKEFARLQASNLGGTEAGELTEQGLRTADKNRNKQAAEDWAEAVKTYDKAFQEMANAGTGSKAAADLQKFMGTADNLWEMLDSPEARNTKRFFQSAFDMANVELSKRSLSQLASGALPEVQAALHGVSGELNLTNNAIDEFEAKSGMAWADLANMADAAAKSIISFGDATKTATDEAGNFSMDTFIAELEKSIAAQDAWNTNIKEAGKIGGTEFTMALMEAGPEAMAAPLQAIIDDMRDNGGQLSEVGRYWMEQIIRGSESGSAQVDTQFAAMRDRMVTILGDSSIADALAVKLGDADYQTIAAGMEAMGREAAQKLGEGIVNGSVSVNEALAEVILAAGVPRISLDFDLTAADLSLRTIDALAEGTVSYMQLDALPQKAEDAIWQIIQTAEGQTAFVEVSASTGEALNGLGYVVDEADGTTAIIPLSADDKEAVAKIDSVEDAAISSKPVMKLTVNDADAYSKAQQWNGRVLATAYLNVVTRKTGGMDSNTITKADGGTIDYYANGGVRQGENHTAQIAPANSYRVWGEAETEGEAYIPFARRKRTRSLAVLDQVAGRFGMSLVEGANVAQYANGGTYELQSRSRYDRMRNNVYAGSGGGVSINEVNFNEANQRDQFREFTRQINRVARGL